MTATGVLVAATVAIVGVLLADIGRAEVFRDALVPSLRLQLKDGAGVQKQCTDAEFSPVETDIVKKCGGKSTQTLGHHSPYPCRIVPWRVLT
jgi:hypothetical protein